MRKKREKKNFWDRHKDFRFESSSDESNSADFSLDGYCSDEEFLDEGKNEGDDIQERLGDDNGKIPLEEEKKIIELAWRENIGGYLWSIRKCGSLATEKREQHYQREIEKPASITRSNVDMFSVQIEENQPHDLYILATFLLAIFPQKIRRKNWKKLDLNYKLERFTI